MKYYISKKEYKGDIILVDCDLVGYKVNPKNKIKDAISVNELIVIKPDFIQKLLKKKVRIMLENLDDDSSSDDSRKALGDIERYRKIINDKYSLYLDKKYISLLNQKINILEREHKNTVELKKKKEKQRKEEEIRREYLKSLESFEYEDEYENKRTR